MRRCHAELCHRSSEPSRKIRKAIEHRRLRHATRLAMANLAAGLHDASRDSTSSQAPSSDEDLL